MNIKPHLAQIVFFLFAPICLASQGFVLPAVISENMVLQGDVEAKLWGWSDAGVQIDVSLIVDQVEVVKGGAIANDAGKFSLALDLSKQTGKVGTLEFSSKGKLLQSIGNVLIGDVWLASGQSNMAFKMHKSQTGKADIGSANYPEIRFFYIPRSAHHERQNDYSLVAPLKPKWVVCNPQNAANFSAVAFYFAHHIHRFRQVPVGVVECAWGGSMCEAWLSRESLTSDPGLQKFYQSWSQGFDSYYKENKQTKFDPIEVQLAKIREQGGEHPVNLKGLDWNYTPQHRPGHLYNAMYYPISGLSLRGVIWYQGESNARSLEVIPRYASAFKALVKEYRKNSGNEQLPVFWVNLAGFEPSKKHSQTWPAFRDVQTQLTNIPHTGQALALDVGSKKNVHPTDKKTVGQRLALCARAVAYGEDLSYQGPQLKDIVYRENNAVLTFEKLGAGKLVIKGKPFFELAGEDGVFHPAQWTQPSENTVILSCERVMHPQSTRYNWRGLPHGHLYNEAGLPAPSFRR